MRTLLAEELVAAIGADADRTLHTTPHADLPAVVLMVGVNGVGKTTTCGKVARVLVADGRRWFIPSDAIQVRRSICLGGPKYSEFEVESGKPFAEHVIGGR